VPKMHAPDVEARKPSLFLPVSDIVAKLFTKSYYRTIAAHI
jgi:hypothetical protein